MKIEKEHCRTSLLVCVDNNVKYNLVPFFLQVKDKPCDEVQLVHLFLSLVGLGAIVVY
jgi:hypothetical protein